MGIPAVPGEVIVVAGDDIGKGPRVGPVDAVEAGRQQAEAAGG
jgi:hypothetical protein